MASGVGAGCRAKGSPLREEDESGARLRVAGYPFDRVKAIIDGRAPVEGYELNFESAPIYELNEVAMSGDQRWDVQEIGLHPYMLAFANDGLRDYTLLPVFPLRTFRHKSIFVRADRGISEPAELRGRKVAVAGYSQSSLVWIRGILEHEYGVRPQELEWVISTKTSEGGLSGNESRLPEGVRCSAGPAGLDESQLLVEGVVDAVLSAKEPQAYIDGDPRVVRLFADYRRAEREYFSQTGIFPIMHVLAMRKDVAERDPELPRAVFEAYSSSKASMYASMRDMGWAMNALPWYASELEETRALMGDNFWPYGVQANRTTLEAMLSYSHEQGLTERRLRIEELFHSATLELIDLV